MIIEEKNITVERSGDFKEQKFGIRDEDLAIVFETLRDLYSDSPLALVREYSANAYDSHIEAGKADVPIEVTLPNAFNQYNFKVRDFGLGLSEEDVFGVFAFYAASGDKRKRNDTIGGFGIGGKSAFSYGDTFSIESIYNGFKYTYNAYLDESNLGTIALLTKEPTNEENGVTVSIPVKPDDVSLFNDAANKIFEFWPVKPIIKGAKLTFEDRKYILSGKDWGIYDFNAHRHVAVVNNIPYSISLGFLPYGYESFKSLGMVFHFGYDEVEVSKNRENIKLTETGRNAIRNRLDEIKESVSKEIKDRISEADCYIDAVKIYNEIFDTDIHAREFRRIIGDLKWNGRNVSSEISFDTYSGNRLFRIKYSTDEEGRIVFNKYATVKDNYGYSRRSQRRSYTPKNDNILIFTRESVKDTHLRGVIKEHPDKNIYVYLYKRDSDGGKADEKYNKMIEDYKPYILEDFEAIRYKRASTGVRNKRGAGILKKDYRVYDGSWNANTEVDFEDDSITFIGVDLMRNKVEDMKEEERINIILEYIKKNALSDSVVIIGLNKSVRYKFRKIEMVSVNEYFINVLKYVRKHRRHMIMMNSLSNHYRDFDGISEAKLNNYSGFLSKQGKKAMKLYRFFTKHRAYHSKLNYLAARVYKVAINKKKEELKGIRKFVVDWANNHPILTSYNYFDQKHVNFYVELVEKTLDSN